MSTTRWPVTMKQHARHRMRERCPDMKPARAVDEVRAAISAGRLSAIRPDWLDPAFDPSSDITLYAWTPDEARVYVLHTTEQSFVVMSVMTGRRQ